MLSIVWSGASDASDIFFLIAAIVAGLAVLVGFVPASTNKPQPHPVHAYPWAAILLALSVCLGWIGFLAL